MLATGHVLLPEEIISMIASKVRDVVFEPKMELWTKISQCLTNTCTTVSHMSESDLERTKDISDEQLEKEWYPDAEDNHQEHVRDYCNRLSMKSSKPHRKSSKLAKCVQVSFHEYSLHWCVHSSLATLASTKPSRLTSPDQRSSRKTSAYALTSWYRSSTK